MTGAGLDSAQLRDVNTDDDAVGRRLMEGEGGRDNKRPTHSDAQESFATFSVKLNKIPKSCPRHLEHQESRRGASLPCFYFFVFVLVSLARCF